MPTGQEYGQELCDVVEYAEKIGCEIAGEVEGETEEGNQISGYIVQSGGSELTVQGTETREFFIATFGYDVRGDIAGIYATDQGSTEGEFQVTDDDIQSARQKVNEIFE